MYCSKCGNQIQDGEQYCSNCGSKVILDKTDIFYNNLGSYQPKIEKPANFNTSLVLAILSALFSLSTFIGFYLGYVLGIVLGAIALQYTRRDRINYGRYNITAKTLAIVGLVLGLLILVLGLYMLHY